jgi:hypothetical protein
LCLLIQRAQHSSPHLHYNGKNTDYIQGLPAGPVTWTGLMLDLPSLPGFGSFFRALSLRQETSAPVLYKTLTEIAPCSWAVRYGQWELGTNFWLLIMSSTPLIRFKKWWLMLGFGEGQSGSLAEAGLPRSLNVAELGRRGLAG